MRREGPASWPQSVSGARVTPAVQGTCLDETASESGRAAQALREGNGGDANLERNFVKTIRRKFGEDAANPAWIFNERGVGNRMDESGVD